MFVLKVIAESQGAVFQGYAKGCASSICDDSDLEGRPQREKTITWEDEEWYLGFRETRGKISFLASAGYKNNQTHTKAVCPVHGKDKKYDVMSQTREVC